MLLLKLNVLEITLDKELTTNCLIETCTKFKEPIVAVLVKYRLTKVQLPLWLQSLINGISWYACLGPQRSANICKVCRGHVELQTQGGIMQSKSLHFFLFSDFFLI